MTEPVELIDDLFATNKEAEQKGVWLTYGKVKFLVARAGGSNDAFSEALAKVMKPNARRFKIGSIKAKEVNEIAMGPFVDHCLLDWKNVVRRTDKGPEQLPYSRENAIKLLTDIPELYTQLMEDAQSLSTFAPEDVSDITKNL